MPTDAELIAICKSTPLERRFEQIGCLMSLVIVVALFVVLKPWWAQHGVGSPVVMAIALAVLALPSLIFVGTIPYHFRTRSARAELNRRFPVPKRGALRKRLEEMKKASGAKWIVLLEMALLPGGGRLHIECESSGENAASLTYLRVPFSWYMGGCVSKGTQILTPEKSRELSELLASALNCGCEKLKTEGIRDGAPMTLLGWNRAANREFTLECNAAHPAYRESGSALVKLASVLTQLQDDKERMVVGSCDAHGNITIEKM